MFRGAVFFRTRCISYLYVGLHTFGPNVSTLTFAPQIIIRLCPAYVFWIRRPRKYRYSRWNLTNMLFLTEGFTISGRIGAILDSHMSVHNTELEIYEQNKYMIPKFIVNLHANGCRTFLSHISDNNFCPFS